jgi:glycosyltransferase involved in cell wall biosynthesis
MYLDHQVIAIIPAMNEAGAIAKVVSELLALGENSEHRWVDQVIVCDNASTDGTAALAAAAGAKVVYESTLGYGQACQTALSRLPHCDIVLFVDGDDSCFVSQAEPLLFALTQGVDLAIGSRALGTILNGALTFPQRFGNRLATTMIRFFWRYPVTDLGPFRAIRRKALEQIAMQDTRFGWTVEMQIKAIQHGLVMREFPVDSKARIGKSKISGTVKGVIGAGLGIIGTILKLRFSETKEHKIHQHT